MACYTPIKAYRGPNGKIFFDSKSGYIDRPLEINCGRCVGCRVARVREWQLRIMHESQLHDRNCFLTLTYDDEHVPDELNVRDWQLFCKRLRKELSCEVEPFNEFRYFLAGEYTDEGRPHFHAAVFGQDFTKDSTPFRSSPHKLWTSEQVERCWRNGFHTVGGLTPESSGYIAKYVTKKVTGDQAQAHYGGRRPEFATMSRGGRGSKGGIGFRWIKKYKDEVYNEDSIVMGGKHYRPPRYYDNLLSDSELELVKRKRRRMMNPENCTPERLADREKVALSRKRAFARVQREGQSW